MYLYLLCPALQLTVAYFDSSLLLTELIIWQWLYWNMFKDLS